VCGVRPNKGESGNVIGETTALRWKPIHVTKHNPRISPYTKLPSPPDFSSEQTSGQAFLNSYTLYLRLAPEQFSCDEEKIFFKDRRTMRWSENLFRQETDTSVFPIQSWADFEQ